MTDINCGCSESVVQGVQLVRSVVVLVEIVVGQCYLSIPPWPLADLVSRGHLFSKISLKISTPACIAADSISNIFPGISEVTDQFSQDKLVLQHEFHSSSSSVLNLIDFLVIVHVFVPVRGLGAQTQALIVSNFQCSRAGICSVAVPRTQLHRASLCVRRSFTR